MLPHPPLPRHITWQACARGDCAQQELSSAQVCDVITRLRAPGQWLRIRDADLRRRGDILEVVRHATSNGLSVQVVVQGADVPDAASVAALAGAGAREVAILDREGDLCEMARAAGMYAAVCTTLCDDNTDRIREMLQDVQRAGAVRWLVGFEASLTPARLENAIEALARAAASSPVEVASQYAPSFLRACESAGARPSMSFDERWGLCLTASGDVTPDPAIPIVIGNVRSSDVVDLYRNHPLLRALRDPDAVEGKCGACCYRARCGGSRARSLAVTGNVFASDPACTFVS